MTRYRTVSLFFLWLGLAQAGSAAEVGRVTPLVAPKRLIMNDDGHNGFYTGRLKDAAAIRQMPQALKGTQVGIYQWGVMVGTKVNYPSRIAELCGEGVPAETLATLRAGDQQLTVLLQKLRADGVDTLQCVTEGCHAAGLLCYASVRMNPVYPLKAAGWTGDSMARLFNSKFWWDHPEWRVHYRDGREHPALSYYFPEVRGRVLGIVREVLERDVDGIDIDFLRHPPCFGYETALVQAFQERFHLEAKMIPDDQDERWLHFRAEFVTDLVREIRRAVDEAAKKKGRPLGLSARIDHAKHLLWGCDVDVWLKEGLLDILVVSEHGLGGWDFDLRPFVAKAQGTNCKIFLGEEATITGRDPTPQDAAKLKPGEKEPATATTMTEGMWFERAQHWYEQGAAGIHIFNGAPANVLKHLGEGKHPKSEASNWPQFRGDAGLAQGTGKPPVEFGVDKNMRWSVEIPHGHSSPCIWGDKIVLTGLDAGKLVTFCLSRTDGRELWRAIAPAEKIEGAHRIGSPASPTPCADAERVHVYFGSYGVVTYDWNGKEVWKTPLPAPVVEFGTGASPVLADGKVFISADQDIGSYLLALDARTGREAWRVQRPEFRRGFSTPFVWRHDGVAELIVAGSLWVRSYDLKDGKQRWSARGMARVSNASPVAANGVLLVSSWNVGGDEGDRVEMEAFESFAAVNDLNRDGKLVADEFPKGPVKDRFSQIDADKDGLVTKAEYEVMRSMFAQAANQLFAIKPGGSGDITDTHVVWKVDKHLPYVSSPTVANGRVFVMKNGGLFSCYDAASGSPIYTAERVDAAGDYYSSGVAADGRVYITSQRGTVVVADSRSDVLKVLARNEIKEQVFASPAIVDGVIYVRTDKHLYAFGE